MGNVSFIDGHIDEIKETSILQIIDNNNATICNVKDLKDITEERLKQVSKAGYRFKYNGRITSLKTILQRKHQGEKI